MASAGMPDAEASARMRRTARRAALWALRDPTASTVGKIASGMPGTALRAGRPNLSLSGGSRRRAPAVRAYAYRRLAGRAAGSNSPMRLGTAGTGPGKSPGRGPDELVGPEAAARTAMRGRGAGRAAPPGGATRARAPRMSGLNRQCRGWQQRQALTRVPPDGGSPERPPAGRSGIRWPAGGQRGSSRECMCARLHEDRDVRPGLLLPVIRVI